MKRGVLSIILIGSTLLISAQHKDDLKNSFVAYGKVEKRNNACDSRVEKTDSVINFNYNSATGEYIPFQLTVYSYNSNYNITEVYVTKLPERTYIYRQLFEYDRNFNQIRYSYFQWTSGSWDMTLKLEKFYSPDNDIISEVYYNKDASGVLQPYMKHYYHYQNGRISDYLRQIKNQSGVWYDFSYHYYIYDSLNRLTILYGQYVNNGPVYWERTAVFEGDNLSPSSRILKQLKYDPALKQNVLTNITLEFYTHNLYGNVTEILYNSWVNGNWEISGKAIYYNSVLKNKKVSICHNGNSLCVSASAVKAHLEHGDKLGKCPEEDYYGKNEMSHQKQLRETFTLSPNPANEIVKINVINSKSDYTNGYILNSSGNLIKTFNARNQSEITVDVSGLLPGTYFIKMLRRSGADSEVLIKN